MQINPHGFAFERGLELRALGGVLPAAEAIERTGREWPARHPTLRAEAALVTVEADPHWIAQSPLA